MSCRSFLLLSLLLLVVSSRGFGPSVSSDYTPATGNYSYFNNRGFIVTMAIAVGCSVALVLYFIVLCLRKLVKERITRQDERANIEMGLIRTGGSVTPRLASAMAVSVETGSNSVRAKASISYPNNAVFV